MKKIYILERFDFTKSQMERLKRLGEIHYYEKANEKEIAEAVNNADAILLDWLDPNPILAGMKKGQFICLPYTGYDWVENIGLAKNNGVIISNTPNYSTNAVAEHHFALILDCAKHITSFNNIYKSGNKVPFNRGLELTGKKVGIIGLGHIGKRLADLLSIFNVEIMTYNRSPARRGRRRAAAFRRAKAMFLPQSLFPSAAAVRLPSAMQAWYALLLYPACSGRTATPIVCRASRSG